MRRLSRWFLSLLERQSATSEAVALQVDRANEHADGRQAWYDNGFYNVGVRPTLEDIALGASHPQFGPLSYTVQRQRGRNIGQSATVTGRVAVNGALRLLRYAI